MPSRSRTSRTVDTGTMTGTGRAPPHWRARHPAPVSWAARAAVLSWTRTRTRTWTSGRMAVVSPEAHVRAALLLLLLLLAVLVALLRVALLRLMPELPLAIPPPPGLPRAAELGLRRRPVAAVLAVLLHAAGAALAIAAAAPTSMLVLVLVLVLLLVLLLDLSLEQPLLEPPLLLRCGVGRILLLFPLECGLRLLPTTSRGTIAAVGSTSSIVGDGFGGIRSGGRPVVGAVGCAGRRARCGLGRLGRLGAWRLLRANWCPLAHPP